MRTYDAGEEIDRSAVMYSRNDPAGMGENASLPMWTKPWKMSNAHNSIMKGYMCVMSCGQKCLMKHKRSGNRIYGSYIAQTV
jgi:hypothetical protein